MDNSLLQIKNLAISFENGLETVHAVKNLNLELNLGESLGIVGESGSGKSVSSLAIMRLLDAKAKISGEIIFKPKGDKSKSILELADKEIQALRGKRIAMIFQEPMTSLNPVYTCGNQVLEAIMKHEKLSKAKAKEHCLSLFDKVKLPEPERIYQSYPHQLSGGQKQRVMIAMALSCKPDLLIADEPTTALDVTVQNEILDLLYELQQEFQMAMIFISHDLAVVSRVCKNIAVMFQGEMVEYGDAKQIFTDAKHAYTKGLLACRPPLKKYYKKLPTVSDFTENKADLKAFLSSLEAEKPKPELSETALVEVQNLCTYYPGKKNFFGKTLSFTKAVDDVSFQLFKGETLGLVGESGCGKSTLGRTILQLQQASSGKVLFQGKDLASLSAFEMRKMRKEIQIIFQDPYSSLNPRMTVGDAIAEPMIVHKLAKRKELRAEVNKLLLKVGLGPEHYDRYPHEFSGGQRQRIGIARALAVKPSFLVCDESVSALDVSVQAQVLNLLNQLKVDFGLTYIFISHDLSVVKYMSDRIMVMQAGKIEEIGAPDEIYENPKSAYTKLLIDSIPENKFVNG